MSYQIRVLTPANSVWVTVTKAEELPSGWLYYELRDGTIGLAQSKNWRKSERPKPNKKRNSNWYREYLHEWRRREA